jgi:type IV pilus assembly protein PilW
MKYGPGRLQRGFGLIELLVALTLGLVLVLGVVQVFVASKQTFVMQRTAAGLSEDARYVTSRLSRELRMVGMFGCVDLDRLPAGISNSIPPAFNSPISYSSNAGNSILKLVTAVPNHENFAVAQMRTPGDYGANWLIATNCKDTGDLRLSDGGPLVVRPGDIVIPLRQMEYRFSNNAIQVRSNGAGNFQTLVDNIADLNVSFGLAATAADTRISGGYVVAAPGIDARRIRSVNLQWQFSDNPAAPASGSVQAREVKQVVALRNAID